MGLQRPAGEPRPGFPNEENLITKNKVCSTGDERRFIDGQFVSSESDAFADGIALHETVQDTVVNRNVANKNAGSGVYVAGPRLNPDGTVRTPGATDNTLHRDKAHRNAEFDGFDGNEDCDNNSLAVQSVPDRQPALRRGSGHRRSRRPGQVRQRAGQLGQRAGPGLTRRSGRGSLTDPRRAAPAAH